MSPEEDLMDPEVCQLCEEPLDAETGEFWDEANDTSVVAHAQCGIDAGMRLA